MTAVARKPTRARALGVTDEDYERLLTAQGGHCALCLTKPKSRRLHVDHDHATGRIRGLLCQSCNTGLKAYERLIALGRPDGFDAYLEVSHR